MEQERGFNKLEDLIPYHDYLKELWDKEDRFRPVLKLLEALYKEAADEVISTSRDGSVAQQMRLAERASQARVYGVLYNLPQVLSTLRDQMEKQQDQKIRFLRGQEMMNMSKAAEVPISERGARYSESLAARLKRGREEEIRNETTVAEEGR